MFKIWLQLALANDIVLFSERCPDGYSYYAELRLCYKYDSTTRNFADSRTACMNEGADLASVHTQGTHDFLKGKLILLMDRKLR